jgi:triphosphoribosyl-dephospho-CoA synthase
MDDPLSIGLLAQTACVWEATARKAGNVHRYRDFDDAGFLDFVLSAAAISPVLDGAAERPVGQTILSAVEATRRVVTSNTNLGMILLLAPLAAVPRGEDLRAGVQHVLANLDVADSVTTYQAIRLASPGGLGEAPEQDVAAEPTKPLRVVMDMAAHRDLVALQYANGFWHVFETGVAELRQGLAEWGNLENAIVGAHLGLLAHTPDTLIARKCGTAMAEEASRRAMAVLKAGWPNSRTGQDTFTEFDTWLRADGHRRNPGATADVIAASLFVALRERIITLPTSLPWSRNM